MTPKIETTTERLRSLGRTRILVALLLGIGFGLPIHALEMAISFDNSISDEPIDGRILLLISDL